MAAAELAAAAALVAAALAVAVGAAAAVVAAAVVAAVAAVVVAACTSPFSECCLGCIFLQCEHNLIHNDQYFEVYIFFTIPKENNNEIVHIYSALVLN